MKVLAMTLLAATSPAEGNFLREFASGQFVDWIALSPDEATIYYTQEGPDIKAVDVATGTALPDFTTGTLDEAFEAATLIQTKKIFDFPLIFVGVDYWRPLFEFLKNPMLVEKAIDAEDLSRLVLTDSVDTVVEHLGQCPSSSAGERNGIAPRRLWQLME